MSENRRKFRNVKPKYYQWLTLASSNIALPDDGDYTEICWSCFNVNFNTILKQFSCASVGDKTLIISRCTVRLWKLPKYYL